MRDKNGDSQNALRQGRRFSDARAPTPAIPGRGRRGGARAGPYSAGAGVGILGAKPSSRVRMFMNSSPVMVSFFWR